MLLGQSRVFYSMSNDGLVPKVFSAIHPRFRTPYKSNMLFFVFTGLFAAFLPEDIVGEMTSIGTLFAFVLVCIGVWILRRKRPDLQRAFKVPAVPLVSTAGVMIAVPRSMGSVDGVVTPARLAAGRPGVLLQLRTQQQRRQALNATAAPPKARRPWRIDYHLNLLVRNVTFV
jgi:amino acid transporter